jgi:hypothetical protein
MDKQFIFLGTFVKYVCKKFYNAGMWLLPPSNSPRYVIMLSFVSTKIEQWKD